MMWRTITLSVLLLAIPNATLAQSDDRKAMPPFDPGWSIYVGGGTIMSPVYPGDDNYNVSVLPYFRIIKGTEFFASVQEGVGYALIEDDGFRAGPVAMFDFGRNEDGSSPFTVAGKKTADLIGLEKIDPSIALGGFIDYTTGNLKLSAKAGRSLWAHEGISGQIAAEYDKRVMGAGPPLFIKVGPNVKFANSKYTQAYFGITPSEAAASGLAPFKAGSGIVSYGIGGSLLLPVSYTAGINFFGGFDRLTGDAANSPLVKEHGSPNQAIAGIAFAKKF